MATARIPRVPPGPQRGFIGTLITPRRDPLRLLTRLAREYGDIVHLKLGGERAFLINDPQLIRDVLVTHQKNFTKSRGLERAKKLLGEGLLTAEGANHVRQRRLIQPAFHRERIAGYADVMVEHATAMRERWQPGATYDVSHEMMRVTLSIVGKTLFDTDVESKADEVGLALTHVMETFFISMLPFQEIIDRLPIPAVRRAQRSRHRLDALIYQLIADRRASGRDHGDLLSMMLAAEDGASAPSSRPLAPSSGVPSPGKLSDQDVRDNALTILLAGHETTANALTWTFYLLSQTPDAEAKLHAEIDQVLEGRRATMADLPRLPYVERVVTEALRLYPPAWIIGRRAIADYQLGDYMAPARSIIFMSPWVTHRDARWYPEPDRFHPDRWTPQFKASLPQFAYLPFGGGSRKCIGDQFALMEAALVLTTVAQKWRLPLVPGHPVAMQPLITLRAKHGMKMIPELRRSSAFHSSY
jgi:cytochrome P450